MSSVTPNMTHSLKIVVLLFPFLFHLSCSDTNRKFNTTVKRSIPGLKTPQKLWWAKEITPDFHVAGRLSERQIKYASEGGFRSILSLFIYETEDAGNFGGQYLPTTAEAWATSHMLGLQYAALIGANDDWGSVETVRKFSETIKDMRKPILLHCDRGYTITFVTLMYMANQTKYNSSFEPKIYSEDFYRITAAMGLDFTHKDLRMVVSKITGEDIVDDPPKHNCEPEQWLDFWLAHPVTKNIFTAGQIRKCDVKRLEATGFKSIVNMRLGVTHEGKPSQEVVTLLNVKDTNSSYGSNNEPPRQDRAILKRNRINAHHSPDYISESSHINFEVENPDEFGDDIGYNENFERAFIKENSSLKYYHVPIPEFTSTYSAELFAKVRATLQQACQDGPVLLHCSVGQRTAYLGVLYAALQENLGLDWALRRLQDLGYEASTDINPDVYKMYCDTLVKQKGLNKEEL